MTKLISWNVNGLRAVKVLLIFNEINGDIFVFKK